MFFRASRSLGRVETVGRVTSQVLLARAARWEAVQRLLERRRRRAVSEAFDLGAYLGRIGYAGPRTPTLSTLRAIHALQPAAIPFESLDPFLRRPVRLDLASLQAKLVGQRRGGYCFELNGLFAGALRALGFSITPLSARVRWMAPPDRPEGARTHTLARLDLPEGTYLADVGFGGHLLAGPIRLEREIEQTTPAATVRLVGKDPYFILQALLPQRVGRTSTRSRSSRRSPIDYEVGNWFTSTNPNSRFYANFLAERLTPKSRLSVFNAKVTERHASGETEQRILATPKSSPRCSTRSWASRLLSIRPKFGRGCRRAELTLNYRALLSRMFRRSRACHAPRMPDSLCLHELVVLGSRECERGTSEFVRMGLGSDCGADGLQLACAVIGTISSTVMSIEPLRAGVRTALPDGCPQRSPTVEI